MVASDVVESTTASCNDSVVKISEGVGGPLGGSHTLQLPNLGGMRGLVSVIHLKAPLLLR